MIVRVLIVDDHAQWRRYLCETLQPVSSQWQVVGEAADGLEAVRQADALDPDLILLDVGLPGVDGIEVARRVLKRQPSARILFLSQHASRDIVHAALSVGAYGYIVKSDAGSELLPAIAVIAEGRRFTGTRLMEHPPELDQAGRIAPGAHRHEVAFCSDEVSLLDRYVCFAEEALHAGNVVVMVAIDSRQIRVRQGLEARGVDVSGAIDEGRYRPLDVAPALSTFMVDGWPDETRFRQAWLAFIEDIARTARGGSPVRLSACGDGAATLWQEGRGDAAVQLERLSDAFSREHRIDVFCGYPLTVPGHPHDETVFQHICDAHSLVHSS